jgi:hypothetical protein
MRPCSPLAALAAFAALAALAAPRGASAFNLISNYPRTAVYNGPGGQPQVRQDRLISFRCDETDFGVARSFVQERPSGDVARVTVTCGRPEYTFDRTPLAHVPLDGRFNQVRLCVTQNPVQTDADGAQTLAVHHGAAHRRNAETESLSGARARLRALSTAVIEGTRRVQAQFTGIAVGLAGGAAACSLTGLCGGGSGGDCDDCVTEEEFLASIDKLEDAQDNFGAKLDGFTLKLETVLKQQNAVDGKLAAAQNATLEIVDQQLQALRDSINVTAQISEHIRAVNEDVDKKFDEVDSRIDVSNAIAAGLVNQSFTATAELRQELDEFANATDVALTSTNEAIARNAQVSREQFARFNAMQRRVTSVVSRLVTTLEAARLRVQERGRLTSEVFAMIEALPAGYIPFLRTAGQSPDPTSAAHPTVTVDETYIRALDGAATPHAHMWRLRYRCFSGFLVNHGVATMGTDALLQTLGTEECDTTNADTIRQTCRCWIDVLHQSCVAVSSGFNTSGWEDDNFLTLTPGDGYCTGASQVASSSTTLRSSTQVSDYMGAGDALDRVCRTLTAGQNYVITNNHPVGKRGLASPDDSLCANWFLGSAMYPPDEAPVNFLLGYLSMLRSSYLVAWLGLGELRDIVKGVLPEGMSTQTNDFDTESGLSAVCTTASFMAYSEETLELARLDPVGVDTAVSVRVECCAADGFTSEDETVTQADVVRDIEMDNLLPGPGFLTVGDITDTVSVYDVPQDDISVSASPSSRAGTVSYAMAVNEADVGNFTHWVVSNGQNPVAPDGAAVAALYETQMTNADTGDGTFTCTTEGRLATSGTLCAVLDNFHVTSLSPTALRLSPRAGSYIGTLPIPDGDLSQVLFSACPTVSFTDSTANGRTLSLQASSQLEAPTDVLIVVTSESSLCQDYAQTVQIQPGSVREVWIPRCVDENEGAHEATVSRVTATGTVLCGSPLDVRVNATFFESVVGLADTGHVARVVVTERDRTTTIITTLLKEMVALNTDTIVQQAATLNAMGIPLPVDFFTSRLNRTNLALSELQTLITSNVRSNDTFAFSDPDALDDIDALLAATGANLVTQQAALDDLKDQAANTSAEIAVAAQLLVNLSIARVELNEAFAQLSNATLATHRLTGEGLVALRENAREGGNFLGIPGVPVSAVIGGIGGAISDAPGVAVGVVAGGFGLAVEGVEGVGNLATQVVGGGLGLVVDGATSAADLVGQIVDKVEERVDSATGVFGRIGGSFGKIMDTIITILLIVGMVYLFFFLWKTGAFKGMCSRGKNGGTVTGSMLLHQLQSMTPAERREIWELLQDNRTGAPRQGRYESVPPAAKEEDMPYMDRPRLTNSPDR